MADPAPAPRRKRIPLRLRAERISWRDLSASLGSLSSDT